MDVQKGSLYPVFDVLKGSGKNGRYTYPDERPTRTATAPKLNEWTVDKDSVLLATAGHLHPGGLHTDMYVTRNGKKTHIFRSNAIYYEPAGAVSWDVSMTATPPDWRVGVKKGDVISISATYDTTRASWYESMGIMVLWMTDGADGTKSADALKPGHRQGEGRTSRTAICRRTATTAARRRRISSTPPSFRAGRRRARSTSSTSPTHPATSAASTTTCPP